MDRTYLGEGLLYYKGRTLSELALSRAVRAVGGAWAGLSANLHISYTGTLKLSTVSGHTWP